MEGLKLPFVVTVTVAASGCGGTVTGSQGDPNGSAGTGNGTSSGGASSGGFASIGGVTVGGQVGVGGSVNPPPPYNPCPATTPTVGDSCWVAPDAKCNLVPSACSPSQAYQCINGYWAMTDEPPTGACNPPPVTTECPATAPPPGEVCFYIGPPCGYGPMCGSYPTQQATCQDYNWIVSVSSCNPPAPPTTTCPTAHPAQGSYCNYTGEPCYYVSGFCTDDMIATCSGFQWYVYPSTCNPPGRVDAGPPDPSADGGQVPIADTGPIPG